jgi:FemAB-related protein (PEP-CTERM system-associated)
MEATSGSARASACAGDLTVSTETDPAAWDAFVSSHPDASIYHRWSFRRVFEHAFDHECVYLSARRGDTIVGILPLVSFRTLLFGRFLVSLPFFNYGGVVADDDEVGRALLARATDEARARKARHVELRHMARRFEDLPCRQHKVAMTMPLADTEEAAWKALDNKVRNQVRKAQKSGCEAAVGGAELIEEFYEVFARNMRDLGTPVYSLLLFDETFRAAPEACRVYVVRRDGQTLAAGFTIDHRDGTENPWASSLREFRSLNSNMLLYWEMIRDAIGRGLRMFDFGRSTPDESTFHFKRQWGAQPSPMFWEYALLDGGRVPDDGPKSAKYARAIEVWQSLPLWLANAAGPGIVRGIP